MNTKKDTKRSSIDDNEVLVTRRVHGSNRVFSHVATDRLGRAFSVYRDVKYDKVVEEKGYVVQRGPLLTYVQLEGHSGVLALWPHQISTRPGFVEGTPVPVAVEQPTTEEVA